MVLEQNAHPGRTNRLLARFARVVVTQFAEAKRTLPAQKVRMLGNPVRQFARRPRGQDDQLVVVIMGGSLAASTLNTLVSDAACLLAQNTETAELSKQLKIIHLAGEQESAAMSEKYTDRWR